MGKKHVILVIKFGKNVFGNDRYNHFCTQATTFDKNELYLSCDLIHANSTNLCYIMKVKTIRDIYIYQKIPY